MSDWAALYSRSTVDNGDNGDNVDTESAALRSLPTVDNGDNGNAESATAYSLPTRDNGDNGDNGDTESAALPSDAAVVTVVAVVNALEEEEAAISPLVATLATLERRCPDAVGSGPWQRAVEDGRRFLVRWGEQAERLGWTEDDIFGLPPVPPNPHPSWRRLARVDQLGLVWITHGRPVTSITSEAATIATPGGGSVAFYRRPATLAVHSEEKPMIQSDTFTDVGLAKFGSGRCAHCHNPTGLRQFKYRDGAIHILHLACAKPFFAAMDTAPAAGEKTGQAEEPAQAPEAPAP